MAVNASDPLAKLRDIHLPDPVSIWPLAPGWYLLAGIIIMALAITAYFAYRYWLKVRPRRAALKELKSLAANDIQQLSSLLRRCALAYYPAHDVASLTGDAWITFLNKTSKTPLFTGNNAVVLKQAGYQKQAQNHHNDLILSSKKWIKHCGSLHV